MTEQHPTEPDAAFAIRRRHEAGEIDRETAIVELIAAFGRITRVGAEFLLDQPGGSGKTQVVAREPLHPGVEMRLHDPAEDFSWPHVPVPFWSEPVRLEETP